MNCEPNDVARVISTPTSREVGIVDLILRVTTPVPNNAGDVSWNFEGPPIRCRCCPGCSGLISCIPDEELRPIRDPGDDAVDEPLLRLPSPRQEVTACLE